MVVCIFVERNEKVCEKVEISTVFKKVLNFTQKGAQDLHKVFLIDLHRFSTKLKLSINTLLDFFDLVAKGEVKF